MAKGYVPVFFDWLDNTQDLNAEEKGHLIDAVVMYASGSDEWIDQLKTSGEKIAFRFMRGQVDRNIEISKARAKARSNKGEQEETNDNKTEQTESKSLNNNNNKNENNNKNKKQNTSPWFDEFWNAYPRHVNKQAAMKAFDKAKIDGDLLKRILDAIERQKETAQWKENGGQFIPHPATWLNGRRWEDEVVTASPKGNVPAQQYTQRGYDDEDNAAMKRMLQLVRDGT